jgi:predicted outer membrane protein
MGRRLVPCALVLALGPCGCGGAPSLHEQPAVQLLADAQVAFVLLASNRGEVTTAGAAEPQLRLPAVDAYARTMIADHTAAMRREEALFAAVGITPMPSVLSDEVMARTLTETLRWALQPPSLSYDVSYICTERDDDVQTRQALERLAPTVVSDALYAETLLAGDTITQHILLAEAAISAQGGCFGANP